MFTPNQILLDLILHYIIIGYIIKAPCGFEAVGSSFRNENQGTESMPCTRPSTNLRFPHLLSYYNNL